MNGIKMSDCRFYVNEEERTVVCVIPNTRFALQEFIEENFEFPDFDVYCGISYNYLNKELKLPHSFMGKAVCAAEDEWNEETGRLIAYSRARDKYYTSFFKRANKLIQLVNKRLDDMIEVFNNFGMKLEAKQGELQAKIDERVTKE